MASKICLIFFFGILSESMLLVQSTDYQKSSQAQNDEGADANYQFQYAVNEGGSGNGNDFGHEEERNGKNVRGMYKVLLPDGRMQIVNYQADENGYRAQVTYENVGGYSAPTPSRQPATSYGPPTQASAPTSGQGYAAPSAPEATVVSSASNSFGRRIPGSFVKLRSNIGGSNHKYNYSL